MEINRNQLRLLLVFVSVLGVTGSYYISSNNNKSINSLASTIEDNKNNITMIKQSLNKLVSSIKTTQSDNLGTSNNDQVMNLRYEALSKELQALKSKNKASKSEPENPVASVENILAEDEDRLQEEYMRKYEDDWQEGSIDAVTTTEIESEVENIFPSNLKGIENVNSECKSTGCKITLAVTDDFFGSPVAMLMDKGGSFFKDKDFIVQDNIDPSTGKKSMSIYVTKSTDDESINNGSDVESPST